MNAITATPASPVRLLRGGIDPERIRVLPRGEHLLVMDRLSGRWATLERTTEPLLRLLNAPVRALPPALQERVASLQQLLHDRGVGVIAPQRSFDSLTTIIVKLTNACNLACAYCYDHEPTERARRLELDHALEAIRQGLDLCERKLWIILHGGEPMLVWSMVEQLVLEGERLAQKRGKQICFTGQSNMTRLSQRVVEFSEEHDIVWGVSVDGDAGTHDRFRVRHDGHGSFDLFVDALNRFPGFVRRCGVLSTITQANDGKLLETARYFQEMGMASWDWTLFQPIGRGREQSATFEPDGERLRASWQELFDAVEAGSFEGFPVLPVTKYLDNFIGGPGRNMCMRPRCGAARDLLSLSSDGAIEACDCIDPLGPLAGLGHIGTTTLEAARASGAADTIRSRDVLQGPCGECIWYGVCGGTCLAHAPSLDDVWEQSCLMSQLAFDRISSSLVQSDRLLEYQASLH